MTSSIEQPGVLQDAARMSTQVIDSALSLVVTTCLVLTCLLITPFFLGVHYWNRLIKHVQQYGQPLKSKPELKGSL